MELGWLQQAALALCLLACAYTFPAAMGDTTAGEVSQLVVHSPQQLDLTEYSIQELETKKITNLLFATEPPKKSLTTGFKVELQTKPITRRLRSLLQATKLGTFTGDLDNGSQVVLVDPNSEVKVLDFGSPRDFTPINGSVPISIIVFMISVNGMKPPITADAFKASWLNKYNTNNDSRHTMQNYYKYCSWGKTLMNENNEVFDLTDVPVPMTGVTPESKRPYSVGQCNFDELTAYQEWAAKVYTDRGGDLSKFTRRVVLMPINNCPWYGLGAYGCLGSYCYVWVRGDRSDRLSTFFHELGHTLQMTHSSTVGQEYGDYSCAMGTTYDRGCFNAPASQKAGWAIPLAELTGDTFPAGKWEDFYLPATTSTCKNFVRVMPSWTTSFWQGAMFPAFYLSYRMAMDYDIGLPSSYANKVSVHWYKGNNIYDIDRPILVGSSGVTVGSTFTDTNTGFVMSFKSLGSEFAQISVCHYSDPGPETNCADGLDNDCNGETDMDDPACSSYVDTCGNGVCGGNETSVTCPKDCPSECGDGLCWDATEDSINCPQDCGVQCSGGICAGVLNANNCPSACPDVCGDGFCTHAETSSSCPRDCACGDGVCNLRGRPAETCSNCPRDCGECSGTSSSPPPPPPPPKASLPPPISTSPPLPKASPSPTPVSSPSPPSTVHHHRRGPHHPSPPPTLPPSPPSPSSRPPSPPPPPPSLQSPKQPSSRPASPPPQLPPPLPPQLPPPPPPKDGFPPPPMASPQPPKTSSSPPPSPPSDTAAPSCGFRMVQANSWCSSSRGTWGPTSPDECANYCVTKASSTPPFCFDYNKGTNHCECSLGPDSSLFANSYDSYNYTCDGSYSFQLEDKLITTQLEDNSGFSQYDMVSLSPPPSEMQCSSTLLKKDASCSSTRSTLGIASVEECAQHCMAEFSSYPPFCFDYQASTTDCECSTSEDTTVSAPGFRAYSYSCLEKVVIEECSYTLVQYNAWCATSRGTWSISSVAECSDFCQHEYGSSPPFCFDFNPEKKHCECSEGADNVQSAISYNAYEFTCGLPGGARRLAASSGNPLNKGLSRLADPRVFRMLSDKSKNVFVLGDMAKQQIPDHAADIVIPYNKALYKPVPAAAQERMARQLLSGGRDHLQHETFCGNKVCEAGEDGESCAIDCCPKPLCGDGICQAYAGEECESCPEDCAGDLDGAHGAPFCCGAYIGCGHDKRCTGAQLWDGNAHKCHTHCGDSH